MKKRIAVLLIGCVCMLSLLGGCKGKKPAFIPEIPTSGGVTDRTDPDAPKQIESEDLISLHTEFFCEDELDESRTGRYVFDLGRSEDGSLTLSVSGVISAGVPVSDAAAKGAQAIIKEQKLAEWNGIDRITAGLAPECGPCSLEAVYASGETIRFRKDGDSRSAWSRAFESYFLQVLTEAGVVEAAPPAEAVSIERFSISFNVENTAYSYGKIRCEDGVERFYEDRYDMEKQETISEKYAEPDDSVYEGLQAVIESCDLASVGGTPITFALEWSPEGFAEIYVDYVNGRQIYAELPAAELPENWPQMRHALLDFFAEVFA